MDDWDNNPSGKSILIVLGVVLWVCAGSPGWHYIWPVIETVILAVVAFVLFATG